MTKTGQHQRRVFALIPAAMFVTSAIATPAAQAQTYAVLHRFQGPPADGSGPSIGHLTLDSAGNLYGTAQDGGASAFGVVFKLDKTGETVMYSFTGDADGAFPEGGLIRSLAGNLYGTTSGGGRVGQGVVYKLDTTGQETVIHTFTGRDGGGSPFAGLIGDSAGNLYGTTRYGGGNGEVGVVFQLDKTGTETVLHKFTGGADGSSPQAGLIQDSAGNLYGTAGGGIVASACPLGCGVVFKLDTIGTYTVLHSFTGGADGGYPEYAGLIQDSAANLYGTTSVGGASGYGVVFRLDTTGTVTVLYNFTGGADGGSPQSGVIQDSAGNLYGTALFGGDLSCKLGATFGCGVVFKLDTTGRETVLYSFTGGSEGANPIAGLILDSAGNLYGTASAGGIFDGACVGLGCGVVFKLQP
jgi:uncharacterized repeat protein (TIGR03803 family)